VRCGRPPVTRPVATLKTLTELLQPPLGRVRNHRALTMSVTSATTAVRARTTTLRVTRSVAVLKRLTMLIFHGHETVPPAAL
jgi:hypothetical protein